MDKVRSVGIHIETTNSLATIQRTENNRLRVASFNEIGGSCNDFLAVDVRRGPGELQFQDLDCSVWSGFSSGSGRKSRMSRQKVRKSSRLRKKIFDPAEVSW